MIISKYNHKNNNQLVAFQSELRNIPYKIPLIQLSTDENTKIDSFIKGAIHQKVKEIEYRKDYYEKFKRFKTGFSGEVAIAHLLEANFVDLTIGDSMSYRGSDMKRLGINVGIKTVEYGKFPIIHRNNLIPQIFVVKKGGTFYVLGVATPEVLNFFQDDQFILDENIRKAGYKTSFTGLSRLEPFYDMEQLLLAIA